MRTILIFKHLDPEVDAIPGKLFQQEVYVHPATPPAVDLQLPEEVWDAAGTLARANPGRRFEAQEQGQTIGIFTVEE